MLSRSRSLRRVRFASEKDAGSRAFSLTRFLTGVLKDLTAAHEARLPAVQSCWAPWLSKQMDLATARLRRAPVQAAVIPLVITMLDSMVPGREADHLSSLLTWADHRRSDVVLASGVIVNGSTQIARYLALAWAWNCVQSYKWTAPQHINVLELTTLLNFLRYQAISGCLCSQRFFHVFDSQVAASVSAKGRFVFQSPQPCLPPSLRHPARHQLFLCLSLDSLRLAIQRLWIQGRGA